MSIIIISIIFFKWRPYHQMLAKSPFAEKMAIFSINWSIERKRLISSEKWWWKLPIRSSQICLYWMISRWYKNDMQEFSKFSILFLWLPKILSKIANNLKNLTLKIYSKNLKSMSIILSHLEIYLHDQIRLNPICEFSKVGQFTWKFDIFSTQWNFPYIF